MISAGLGFIFVHKLNGNARRDNAHTAYSNTSTSFFLFYIFSIKKRPISSCSIILQGLVLHVGWYVKNRFFSVTTTRVVTESRKTQRPKSKKYPAPVIRQPNPYHLTRQKVHSDRSAAMILKNILYTFPNMKS